MSQSKIVNGALVALALGTMVSVAHADSYYGPRQVGDKCWTAQAGISLGYWGSCKKESAQSAATTGRTANASVARSNSTKKPAQ